MLSLRNVSKGEFACLDQVDFTLHPNDYTCLVGRSGSGKSTFLHLLAGFHFPDSGQIHWLDGDLGRLDDAARCAWRARSIGYVFQDFRLISALTVAQNLELALEIGGLPCRQRPARIHEALDFCDLLPLAGRWPQTLSGGEKQRVAIARAMVGKPEVILADEPTGNLDLDSRDRILGLFDRCHQQGASLLLVSHDKEVALRARRVVRLEKGALLDVAALV